MYSGELPFPKIEITISGKNSKIRKTAVPIASTRRRTTRTVSFTRPEFPAPILNPIIGWPPRLIPITTETTIPKTFITIPTTARGTTEPNATPVLAKVSYPYLESRFNRRNCRHANPAFLQRNNSGNPLVHHPRQKADRQNPLHRCPQHGPHGRP